MSIGFTGGANNYAYTTLTGLSSSLGNTLAVRFKYTAPRVDSSLLLTVVDGGGGYTSLFVAAGADQLLVWTNGSGDATGGTLRRGFVHHALMTIDGSGNVTGFIDGRQVLADTGAASFTPGYALVAGNDVTNLNGVVQDVMIWDRVLTRDEIAKQARSRKPVSRRGLVNWHPFSWRSRNPGGTSGPILDWPMVGSSWLPSTTNFTVQRDLEVPVQRRAPMLQLAAGGTQTVEPPLLTNTSTLYGATVTPGAVSLSPPAISDGDTLYAATLSVGATTVAPPLLTNTSTLYGPTVTAGAVTVSPPLISDGDTLYAPTVVPGAVSVEPPLITNTSTLYEPVVSQGGVTLGMPLIDDGDTLYAPAVVGAQRIEPPLIDTGNTLYTATVTPGVVTVEPPPIDATSELYAPTITQGGTTIEPPLLTNTSTLYGATVTPGSVALSVPLLDDGDTLYPPTVDDGTTPPEPEPAPVSGVPGGRGLRAAVRIDGELYVGTYAEISELVATLGERDALAEVDEPVPSARAARSRARKAAGRFARSLQVVDIGVPVPLDLGIDPAPIAQRDLREDYLRAYASAVLHHQQQAQQQALLDAQRRAQELEDDDMDAINRALELL